MENGSLALVTLPRRGDFPSLDAVEAVFIGSSLVRENDHPLRMAKHFLGSGLFRARESNRLFCVAIEAVREDEEGRRPKPDEDAETLRMRLDFGGWSTGQKPDGDRADDGGEVEDEAEVAELFELSGFHGVLGVRLVERREFVRVGGARAGRLK